MAYRSFEAVYEKILRKAQAKEVIEKHTCVRWEFIDKTVEGGAMSVWCVMDGEYDGDWVVAVYATEELAREHMRLAEELMNAGCVVKHEVLTALHPDASDPAKLRDLHR
jgi:hypothetical protein